MKSRHLLHRGAGMLVLALPATALAHGGIAMADWTTGLTHPLGGADHLLAMLAVGLWAGRLGGRAAYGLPLAFLLALLLGAVMALARPLALPLLESGLAVSVLALGVCLIAPGQIWNGIALLLTAAFGALHGYAHGLEWPAGSDPLGYAAGFFCATVALHLGGVALALRLRAPVLTWLGGGIAAGGLTLLALS